MKKNEISIWTYVWSDIKLTSVLHEASKSFSTEYSSFALRSLKMENFILKLIIFLMWFQVYLINIHFAFLDHASVRIPTISKSMTWPSDVISIHVNDTVFYKRIIGRNNILLIFLAIFRAEERQDQISRDVCTPLSLHWSNTHFDFCIFITFSLLNGREICKLYLA